MDKIFSPIKGRVIEYIERQCIKKEEFYIKTGITSSNFKGSGKLSEIGGDKIAKILSKYCDLNPEWLLTGKGEMLRDKATTVAVSGQGEGTPYYAVDFLAGFDPVFNDQTVHPDAMISFPNIKGAECWVDVSGRSMEPLISPGDVIAIKKINDWRSFILYGEVYAIVTPEYRTIKRIRKATIKDYITLVPENPDYDSQDILADSIRAVYQVLGCAKKIF